MPRLCESPKRWKWCRNFTPLYEILETSITCWGKKEETLWYLRESGWAISGPQRGTAVASMSGSLEEPRGLSLWPRVENYAGFTRLGSLGPIKGLTSGQCLTP